MATPERNRPRSWTDQFLRVIQDAGAALTVGLALFFTFLLGVVALALVPAESRLEVATAALAAIGTLAGTYAGVRVGSHGREQSEQERRETQLVVDRVAEKVGDGTVKEARDEIRQESPPPRSRGRER